MSESKDLNQLREEISRIDDELIHLAARRLEVAQEVGRYKLEQNLPIKDYDVEKQIIEKTRNKAKERGVYPDMMESILKTLIEYSVMKQSELIKPTTLLPTHSNKKILIVGGMGQMGNWLAHFFNSLGHAIWIYDVLQPSKKHNSYFEVKLDLPAAAAAADIIVLATPLSKTAALIDEMLEIMPRGIVVDICSLKSPVLMPIKKALEKGLRFVSIHPMFGPNVEVLAGNNIILCEDVDSESLLEIESLLQRTSAQLIRIPLQKHDPLMSYVLGSAHLLNLFYGDLCRNSGFNIESLKELAGTTFRNQYDVTQTVILENQDLYYEIQALNEYTPKLFEAFESIFGKYKRVLADKDRIAFKKLMNQSKIYFDGGKNDKHKSKTAEPEKLG